MANQSSVRSSTGKSMRGFASMDPVRQRQIASLGGRATRANAATHHGKPVIRPSAENDQNKQ